MPPFAEGLVRDLRVRWALEEAGLPYQAKLIDPAIQGTPEYREAQPFGQVPTYEEGGLTLFESGAIVLHIGARSEALLPTDDRGRRARSRGCSRLSTASRSPSSRSRRSTCFTPRRSGRRSRRPEVEARVQKRLSELSCGPRQPRVPRGRVHCGRSDDDLGAANSRGTRSWSRGSRSSWPTRSDARRAPLSSARSAIRWRPSRSGESYDAASGVGGLSGRGTSARGSLRDPVSGVTAFFPPGGGVEPGESPAETARRETLEEAGLRVRVDPAAELVVTYPFRWAGSTTTSRPTTSRRRSRIRSS